MFSCVPKRKKCLRSEWRECEESKLTFAGVSSEARSTGTSVGRGAILTRAIVVANSIWRLALICIYSVQASNCAAPDHTSHICFLPLFVNRHKIIFHQLHAARSFDQCMVSANSFHVGLAWQKERYREHLSAHYPGQQNSLIKALYWFHCNTIHCPLRLWSCHSTTDVTNGSTSSKTSGAHIRMREWVLIATSILSVLLIMNQRVFTMTVDGSCQKSTSHFQAQNLRISGCKGLHFLFFRKLTNGVISQESRPCHTSVAGKIGRHHVAGRANWTSCWTTEPPDVCSRCSSPFKRPKSKIHFVMLNLNFPSSKTFHSDRRGTTKGRIHVTEIHPHFCSHCKKKIPTTLAYFREIWLTEGTARRIYCDKTCVYINETDTKFSCAMMVPYKVEHQCKVAMRKQMWVLVLVTEKTETSVWKKNLLLTPLGLNCNNS